MGEFFDSIQGELRALDEPPVPRAVIGADYDTNASVVKQVQAAVNAAGYSPPLAVDGAYGPNTKAGIVWYQTQQGLTADGIIGDQTLGALGITPPAGTSIQSLVGAGTSLATSITNALSQFAPLLSWSENPQNAQTLTQGKGVAPGFQATRASVVNSYVDWTTPFEGFLPFMYIDALGYVTTGMGNLIDPISAAMDLPWKNADGSRATPAQITAAWNAVDALRSDPKGTKQTSGPATQGGGSQGGYTSIRITKADVQSLVAAKMKANEDYIMSHMPSFANAPADAQMAVHSMAWAMGPGFSGTWTQFKDAFDKADYGAAAEQSHMQGVGIDMRNMANKLLLTNAAQVRARGFSPDTLFYITGLPSLFAGTPLARLRALVVNNKRKVLIGGAILAFFSAIVTTILVIKGRHPAHKALPSGGK